MFFDQHSELLNKALEAIHNHGYWSPFSESPSPRVYGETAAADGKAAFDAMLNNRFDLDFPGAAGTIGSEVSPFGLNLNVSYPKVDLDGLIEGMQKASKAWAAAGPKAWVGVALEALNRINKRSFEIASAVMHTTGQPFVMAFQAGAGQQRRNDRYERVSACCSNDRNWPEAPVWEWCRKLTLGILAAGASAGLWHRRLNGANGQEATDALDPDATSLIK